ncbi:MAG: TPM domain-containing protein, partial [Acidobacteriota bacterium]|nr:TPM domain-containing protein [Acidobacteriota bacterium]
MSAQALPKPDGYVNDFAGILDAATRARLEQRLKEVEAASSSEIAVATVKSLEGMSVEEYTTRLFKEWGVGQEKTDNGVLILVAPNDREIRIEVGYGLEGVLPDGLAGEIRDEQFLPRFRDDDYSGGISAGDGRIADIVEKIQVLSPEELARFNESSNDPTVWILVPFLGMFIAIGSFMLGLGLRTKTVFPILFGGLFSGIPMLMALLVMFTVTLYTLAPLWLAMAVTGYRLGSREKWKESFRPGKGGGKGSSGSGSGWVMGGGSSGG